MQRNAYTLITLSIIIFIGAIFSNSLNQSPLLAQGEEPNINQPIKRFQEPFTTEPISLLPGQSRQGLIECVDGEADGYPCKNVDLLAHVTLGDLGSTGIGNDIWGWTDPLTGIEYALMGMANGTSFVDLSDPENPVVLGVLPTHTSSSSWRDIKVYADHAFIVSEASGHGMQVFDLTQLRDVTNPPVTFSETAHYDGFGNAHNLVINEDSGFAYGVGGNCSGGLHMVNIQDPTNPVSAGCVSSDGYTHDAQCIIYNGPDTDYQGNELCFNSNEDTLTIFDVTTKTLPILIAREGYAGSRYTHQGWITEDHTYFLLDDELDESNNGHNTRTYIWNLTDLDNPVLINNYTASTAASDHNLYIRDHLVYQSNYRAGLRILDVTNASYGILSEVGYFDTYPPDDNPGASSPGSWSNYPYFESGVVIVSSIDNGLFIVRPRDLTVSPPTVESCNSGDAVYDIAATLLVGGNYPVNLSVANPPAGSSVVFNPNPLIPANPEATGTLTIGGADVGNYNLNIVGETSSTTYTRTVALNVFDNTPVGPALVSPGNDMAEITLTPTFSWTAIPGVNSYNIEIATDPDFNNIVNSGSNLANTSYTPVVALAPNTVYYWRVQGNNICGSGNYSTVYSFRTIVLSCAIYNSTDVPQSIPSSGTPTITSGLTIPAGGTISDINLLNLEGTHTYMSDLSFYLDSPNATQVLLMGESCGSSNDFDINLDDEAAPGNWPCPPVDNGTYQPTGTLSDFDGEDSTGTWVLTIADSGTGDGGQLSSWSLEICTATDLPYLPLTKTADDNTPVEGQLINYAISVVNNGNSDASSVVISDTLPGGLTFAGPVTLTPPQGGAVLAQNASDLPTLVSNLNIAMGERITVTLPVTVNPGLPTGTTITNTATVNSLEDLVPKTGSEIITLSSLEADVTLNKSVDNVTPEPNQQVIYTINVVNNGNSDATGALVSDTLVSGLTLAGPISLNPPQAGAILAQNSGDLPTLASGLVITANTQITLTFPATVSTGLPTGTFLPVGTLLVNTAAVTSAQLLVAETSSVTLTVANVAPVAEDDSGTTTENTPITLAVLDNDTDLNGDPLSLNSVTTPANGTASISNSTIIYTPTTDFNGVDIFMYSVEDPYGLNDTGMISITVNAINNTPDAVDDLATTNEDTALTIFVLANDSDPDGDNLSVSSVSTPGNGTATTEGTTVVYTPTTSFTGTDTFTYIASDGTLTDTAMVTVTVTASGTVNNAPNAVDDLATTNEDTALTIFVLANDSDPDGDNLSVSSVSTPGNGTATTDGTTVVYTPTTSFTGTDTFTYYANDGLVNSNIATVTITVNPATGDSAGVNLIAPNPTISGAPGTTVNYTLWVTNTGTTTDTFTLSIGGQVWTSTIQSSVGPLASGNSLSINSSVIIPASATNGMSDTVTITATSQTDASATANLQLTTTAVAGFNNAPQFSSTPVTNATEDTLYTYMIIATDADADDNLTITVPIIPAWLRLIDGDNDTATLSGTPITSDVGDHLVHLMVSDGLLTDTQTFTITVSSSLPQNSIYLPLVIK